MHFNKPILQELHVFSELSLDVISHKLLELQKAQIVKKIPVLYVKGWHDLTIMKVLIKQLKTKKSGWI